MAAWKQKAGLATVLATLGTGAGALSYYWWRPGTAPVAVAPGAISSSIPVVSSKAAQLESLDFVSQVVSTVGAAVVKIDATDEVQSMASEAPQVGNRPRSDSSAPGSGFIITADGQIVTNAHVVGKAPTVQVTLRDGRVLQGKVLGRDTLTDVALVQVAGQSNLPTVKFSTTEVLTPGQWAIAIGSPLGLDNTVTLGIISAVGRSSSQVGAADIRSTFIQTDVAINPGNSGGPLLNAQGEAIGINTAIRQDGQGLSFAIPAKTAQRISQQLLKTGRAVHPYLGIQMAENQKDQAPGVLVAGVLPNTPAAQGGLQEGDRILKLGNTAVKTADELQSALDNSPIGQPLKVEIDRRGQQQTLTVTPVAYPQSIDS
jgi:S1-C subfamily serine protease